jgi:hypothetical protein
MKHIAYAKGQGEKAKQQGRMGDGGGVANLSWVATQGS